MPARHAGAALDRGAASRSSRPPPRTSRSAPHEAEDVAERSGGNPLFLLELLDAVRASGSIESLPDSVEALIAGEIDRLAPTDRTILRYAVGPRDPASTPPSSRRPSATTSSSTPRCGSGFGDLLTPDPDGGLRFENTLVRDAAYEGLPYRRRRALHERVGETIEATRRRVASRRRSRRSRSTSTRPSAGTSRGRTAGWPATGRCGSTPIADASRFYERALIAGRQPARVQRPIWSTSYASLSDASDVLGRLRGRRPRAEAARRLRRQRSRSLPRRSSIKQAILPADRVASGRRTSASRGRCAHSMAFEGRRRRRSARG